MTAPDEFEGDGPEIEAEGGAPQQEAPQETLAPEDAAPPLAPTYDAEDERAARMLGWKPSSEWRGDLPAGYIEDPSEWLNRKGNRIILQNVQREIAAVKEENAKRWERIANQRVEAEKARLQAEMRKAVELGDVEAFEQLDKQREQIERPSAPPPQAPEGPQMSPQEHQMVQAWVGANADLVNGPRADEANRLFFQELAWLPVKDRLLEMDRRLKSGAASAEPPAPARMAKVDGGGLPRKGGKDPFDALPADKRDMARRQFNADVERGLFKDDAKARKAWVDTYLEDT